MTGDTPAADDPSGDPGSARGGGGGGTNGPTPITGKNTAFGNEGVFNANRRRGSALNSLGGLGSGIGGGGVGGGGFFGNGFTPLPFVGNSSGSGPGGLGNSGGSGGGIVPPV